ncbi:MAG: YbhB/YbcL family Raf kinase inhibitor-like protein [Myxococcales bacterium]|nr:YbhB/YbcL family Raf kinase inhibitor-like protein [Myxococcales bacterium]
MGGYARGMQVIGLLGALVATVALAGCGDDSDDAMAGDSGDGDGDSGDGDGDSGDGGDGDGTVADAGSGDGDSTGDGDGAGDAGSSSGFGFTDALTMGETIPDTHKCESPIVGGGMGDNLSPALAWQGAPEGTESLALVLFDTRYSVFHWALWDIPASVNELPEGIAPGFEVSDPPGARQGAAFMGDANTYFGPCSSASPLAGVYEFRLYALDVASLELEADATAADVQAAIDAATIEMIAWEGTPE